MFLLFLSLKHPDKHQNKQHPKQNVYQGEDRGKHWGFMKKIY